LATCSRALAVDGATGLDYIHAGRRQLDGGVVTMIRETASELRTIAQSCNDAAGYFPAMYSRVTTQIAKSIDGHAFVGGSRMDTFATEFATRYTRAWKREIPRPRCWQASWDVAADGNLLIVQQLLLGINAHVNYDLPQAVVEVARETGDLVSVRKDFDAVNDVLAEVSVGVLSDLDRLSHWTSAVAALGGGRAFNFSLRTARAQAWSAAERLYALDDDEQRAYIAELDELVSVLAYLITRPPIPVAVFAFLARFLEQRDPTLVISGLLGAP
jgi:Family of unknown function (DUF5995)